jgi:hypothetical protein
MIFPPGRINKPRSTPSCKTPWDALDALVGSQGATGGLKGRAGTWLRDEIWDGYHLLWGRPLKYSHVGLERQNIVLATHIPVDRLASS